MGRRGECSLSAQLDPAANWVLAALPPALRDRLLADARIEDHESGTTLFKMGDAVREFAFPLSGIVSLTVDTSEGQQVEVAITGKEGVVGIGRLLGFETADTNAVVQVAGGSVHIPAAALLDQSVLSADGVRPMFDGLIRGMLVETAQSAVCNQVHSVEQRTARWLLHASDRADTVNLRLTHEFLAQMLGVRRASVTTVVGIFSRARLITTQRGLINIDDRDGLRSLTCECYDVVLAASPTY